MKTPTLVPYKSWALVSFKGASIISQSKTSQSKTGESNISQSKTGQSKISQLKPSKLLVYLGVLLLFVAVLLVGNRIIEAQPNRLIIKTDNLTASEYNILQTMTKDYFEVSGLSFFTTSLPDIEHHIKTLSWVNQVDIKRQWQDGLVVTVFPRRAVARFGSERLIDAQGEVFKPVDAVDLSDKNLVMLQSEVDQSFLIMQQMQQINQWFMPLDMAVEDMVLTPRMTWVIKFNNGLRVVVDNESTAQKLINLSQLLQNQLAVKRDAIASVDLRYKNGFAIDWYPKSPN